jgi:autotransporter translocation and assembly factor TamB
MLRRLARALIRTLTLVAAAAAAAIVVSQTAWFKNWLREYIVREASQYLNGTLSIERLGGNLFFGIEMENIGVSVEDEPVLAIHDVRLGYNVFELVTKGLSVDYIRLNGPVLHLQSLGQLVKKQQSEADRSGPGRPISINEIGITGGTIVVDGAVGAPGVKVPRRLEQLDAKFSFKYEPVRYTLAVSKLSFRAEEPALALDALSGGVSVTGDTVVFNKVALRTAETSLSLEGAVERYLSEPALKLQISSDKVSLPELARIIPSLQGVRLQPAFELKLDGPLERLGIETNVRASAGQLTARLRAGLAGLDSTRRASPAGVEGAAGTVGVRDGKVGLALSGDISVRHLDLAPILNDQSLRSDLTADARLDLKADDLANLASVRGSVSLKTPQISIATYAAGPIDASARVLDRSVDWTAKAVAYGANLDAAGHVTLPKGDSAERVMAFDLKCQARGVDLRRLPRDWQAPQAASELNADYQANGKVPIGRRARSPITVAADARFLTSHVAGATIADGSTAGVSWDGRDLAYRADATLAGVDLRQVGQAFNLPALAADRYSSSINGHIVGEGRGTTPRALQLTASGTLSETVVMGVRVPNLTFDGTFADDNAHIKTEAAFENFNPALPTGKTVLEGALRGHLNLDATIDGVSRGVTIDSVQATARVYLDRSRVGGLDIAHATLDGTYEGSTGDIRQLEIVGNDLNDFNFRASGRLALDETGQSNLKVQADSSKIETLARLFDQSTGTARGIAQLRATVTGNRRKLQASGTATGDGLDFHGSGALAAFSDFTATLSALDPDTVSISATTQATLVNIAGQHLNELTVDTNYAERVLNFDAVAKQPERSLTGAGSLLLHPEDQEVQLNSLGFESRGVRWQTAAGARPTIRYAGGRIAVDDLRLVNGNQRASVNGTFGASGETLNVTLADLDLATVDALLLRPPQVTGKLNGSARITGTTKDPAVTAEFTVAQGSFSKVKYEALGGTVRYSGNGVDVDARLQQNPTTWVTAKGYAPLAPTAERKEYDLHVDSSPIDLGLFSELVPRVTSLKGTIEAKVAVIGPSADPHPLGAVTIANAAFTTPLTGVSYSQLEGRIDLLPEKVHIDELRLVDNHQQPLTITGDLAIREREVGGVAIDVKSTDFKIIDNKLGSVRVNSNLRIAGELSAPRIDGDLDLSTGQINLDPIIAMLGDTAYATQETSLPTDSGANQAPASSVLPGDGGPGGEFDALQMYVHVTAPNDLVVKANDVRRPGAPIGLGGLNVRLGSDVYLSKAPWDQIRFIGVVNTVRGTYDFQGRRFTILRDGKIRFEGLDEFDAALDVRAERVIHAVTANVNIRGTLRQPELALSSTPPLEEADILSLIVFNQPINQLAEGQQASLASRAQSLALGAAAGHVSQSIGNALGLDTFEFNLAPESGSAPEITVGQQIGQNLYVKVQQGLGDQSQTNLILEYELTKWLRFRTNIVQGPTSQAQLFQRMQGSGVDLLFFFSY